VLQPDDFTIGILKVLSIGTTECIDYLIHIIKPYASLMLLSRTHKRRLPDDDVHTSKHVAAVGY
jgi:hypothetical protein